MFDNLLRLVSWIYAHGQSLKVQANLNDTQRVLRDLLLERLANLMVQSLKC